MPVIIHSGMNEMMIRYSAPDQGDPGQDLVDVVRGALARTNARE